MAFTKKQITAKTLCIIDIGSYKLRVCGANFKNGEIHILWYHEKRQDISYFANNECLNLPWLCENISEAIKKLEQSSDLVFDNIIINYPFWELFLWCKSINYKRDSAHRDLTTQELEKILSSTEKLCLDALSDECERLYGMDASQMQIILSRINNISIDGHLCDKVIWKQWSQIKISLLNAFIPSHKYKLISQIWTVLQKNIYRILPSEYCMTKIFPDKNLLIINLWATQTSVSVKRDGELLGISKIPIWINDLVNKISKNSDDTKAHIINSLKFDDYLDEKVSFVKIWWDALGMSLSELLGRKTCPKKIYIWGGGSNNEFIKKYIEHFDFARYGIKSLGKSEFIHEDISSIISKMKNIKIEEIHKIPLEIYVLLEEVHTIISREWDILSSSLKKAIKKLWYISNI